MRLNFSHGSHDDHARLVRLVRETSERIGKHVAVLQDLQGPRIRTGPLKGRGPLELPQGSDLLIVHEQVEGEDGRISSTYPDIHRFLEPGNRILLDDGRLEAEVLAVEGQDIRCRVTKGGLLGEFQGINLPGVRLDIPTFTEKDREDLEFGLSLGVDWVAMSFVSSGDDAKPLRDMIRRHRQAIPLIAKVERATALANLDGILRAFDGVMVARGDMGVELSPEDVPVWQRTMLQRARLQGKLAIVATQMLESMITESRPTRAEASDVANAVWEGADAVMLSGETAIGAHPVEAVSVMARIIERVQETSSLDDPGDFRERRVEAQAVARAACRMAGDLNAKAIVVLTRSGVTAYRVQPPSTRRAHHRTHVVGGSGATDEPVVGSASRGDGPAADHRHQRRHSRYRAAGTWVRGPRRPHCAGGVGPIRRENAHQLPLGASSGGKLTQLSAKNGIEINLVDIAFKRYAHYNRCRGDG